MRRSRANLRCHELIGLEVVVVDHSDNTLRNLSGMVVWETRNTLVLKSSGREIVVPKQYAVFSFRLPETGQVVVVSGDEILQRPEDRLKMCGDAR